ncbi:methyltransferase domain-containing protein [Alteromonas sp. W364]|uniref:class I SAM-dependent methyltransferase n=1 Tax=Alteromonas sp. W364 TaxID=3075610 RepID=UPI0028875FB5|nr:methyltransferase domain-containing protein [Alteromonas sp. W364]MDT0628068.1 methyltransferase domain-containing protein [Alteromonas sp. W364]
MSNKSFNYTFKFYEENAKAYFKSSIDVDLTHLYPSLLNLLPIAAKILDAGCGSGRDTKYFKDNGYMVTAFDASAALAHLASEYSGLDVQQNTFESIKYTNEFDAVWACASLLHLSQSDLSIALASLAKACKDEGLIFASFKTTESASNDGRSFYYYEMVDIEPIINSLPSISVLRYWYTGDALHRADTNWLNLLLKVSR